MARTEIPARRIVRCDRCGVESERKLDARDPQLILKQHALDYQGSAVADGTLKWDLCGTCWDKLRRRVEEFLGEAEK